MTTQQTTRLQALMNETSARWEREAIVAIAKTITAGRVAKIKHYQTTTGKGEAVEVESTEHDAQGFPYRWACLVSNYEAAVCGEGFYSIPPLPS